MGSILSWINFVSEGDDEDPSMDFDSENESAYVFDSIDLQKSRDYDCVLVFDLGDKEKEWKRKLYDTIEWDYLKLLDSEDIETRKDKFPHNEGDFPVASGNSAFITMFDFNKNERRLVIKSLTKLEILSKSIKCVNNDPQISENDGLKFYYIGIREQRARKFANKIGYNLEIDSESVIKYLYLNNEALAKATVCEETPQDDRAKDVRPDLWRNIFVDYDYNVAPEIYREYYGMYGSSNYEASLFRIRDRISLINNLITRDVEFGGAGINIPELSHNIHTIVDFFPLHTLEHLQVVLDKFFSINVYLDLPLEELRCYFGEYIAIYFAFLQFQTKYFVIITFIGCLFGTAQVIYGTVLMPGIEWFAVTVIIWSIFFPIFWKRIELLYSKKWGTLRFHDSERDIRAEFKGSVRYSAIDGNLEDYYAMNMRNKTRCVNFGVVFAFLIGLIGSILAIIFLRIYVTQSGQQYGSYIVAFANTLVIMFFNNAYGIIAEKMNEWENYKTETEYENNLIVKLFIFRFINSYATLYYIAFFRVYESETSPLYCTPEACMSDLRIQLAIIFVTQLVTNNVLELAPLILQRFVGSKDKLHNGFFHFNSEKDYIYNQYASNKYERTFDDYCELLILMGYSTLFVVAFPFAPAFAFIGCIVEARIDAYKLCKLSRRPFPRQAQCIGSWQLAIEVMAWATLITNVFIICFTTEMLDFLPQTSLGSDLYFQELVTSLILVAILFLIVWCLNFMIGSQPQFIKNHIKRQIHIEHELKKIGSEIENYIDLSLVNDVMHWKSWSVEQVATYLHKVLYKNVTECDSLKQKLHENNFDGKMFSKCDEYTLSKVLALGEYEKRFVLTAREQLIEHQNLAMKQDQLVECVDNAFDAPDERDDDDDVDGGDEKERKDDDEDDSGSDEEGGSRSSSTSGSTYHGLKMRDSKHKRKKMKRKTNKKRAKRKEFNFALQNLYKMAEFYEEELKPQSKRKLWSKVEKDMIDIVREQEMETFIYLTIVVYIKGNYKNAKLPKFNDAKFKERMLVPMKDWLWNRKISPPGMTFYQFNEKYPQWIREYYKASSMNYASPEMTISPPPRNRRHGGNENYSVLVGSDGSSPSLEPTLSRNPGKARHSIKRGGSRPITSNLNRIVEEPEKGQSLHTPPRYSHSQMSGMEMWNEDSKKWYRKMGELSDFIDTCTEATKVRIWEKFDKKGNSKLQTSKYLPKMLYSFIALYIKVKYTDEKPPNYKELLAVTRRMSMSIIQLLPTSQKQFIDKYHFQSKIQFYVKKFYQKEVKSMR